MVSLTLSIPEEIRIKMQKFPEMNWSEIARAAIMQRIILLEKFRQFTKDSEFTEEDAIKFGKELNKNIAKKRLSR